MYKDEYWDMEGRDGDMQGCIRRSTRETKVRNYQLICAPGCRFQDLGGLWFRV